MATENECSGLKVLDPVQGLVDYVNDIKPYHTKVVEVLIEYVYEEPLEVTIEDKLHTQIDMYRPERCATLKSLENLLHREETTLLELTFDSTANEADVEQQQGIVDALRARVDRMRQAADCSLEYWCPRGYGLVPYGAPQGGWPIIPPSTVLDDAEYNTYPAFDTAAGSVTIPGDRSSEIRAGDTVQIVSWIEDYSDPENIVVIPDPTTNFNKSFVVTQVEFNAGMIPSWNGFPDTSLYRLGEDPHTIVTLDGGFGSLPVLPLPGSPEPKQAYVAFLRLGPVEVDRVYSYSNALITYDSGSPSDFSQEPDEGYLRRDILGIVVSTLDMFGVAVPDTGKIVVSGNLLKSNIFVDDLVSIFSSSGNNGQYTITSLVYDDFMDETTIGVAERIRDNVADGIIRIDIPSNVFVIDGDYSNRFQQGYTFNIAGGSFSGRYTTLSSDIVRGKTRVRTTRDIVDTELGFDILDATTGFVVRGDKTSKFTTGSQANVVGSSTNDGSYEVLVSTYDSLNNETTVTMTISIDPAPGGQLFAVQMGVIKETTFGFGESSNFCATTPETMVRVKFHERLHFDGLGLDLTDDLIVYNMENNDSWGYELPLTTVISSTEPLISELPTPPFAPSLNDLWFNTSLPGTSPYESVMHRFNGGGWEPITTAYWLDSDTNILHYRTRTAIVDTGWIVYLAEPPGFDHTIPAVGKTEIKGVETFIVEEIAPGIPQSTFTFETLTYTIADIVDGTASGHEDYFEVDGNVRQDADGISFTEGSRILEVVGGGANDGLYTISQVVYISGNDRTKIYVEENIPTTITSGDLIIGPLTVPTSGSPLDQSLIRVTVNGIPAQINLDTPTQFTILSPDYGHGDTVIARVYDTTGTETNASVGVFGNPTPHRVFHNTIATHGSPPRAYTLYGGNYVRRMIPQNRLEIYDFAGGGLVDTQHPMLLDVLEVDPIANTITVDGSYDWLFTSGVVLTVITSEGTYEEFNVSTGSPGAQVQGSPARTIIPVVEDVHGRISRVADYHFDVNRSWDVYEIDNVADAVVVEGDFRLAFPVGTLIKVFDSTPDNSEIVWTVSGVTYDAVNGRTIITVADDIPDQDPNGTVAIVVPAQFQRYESVMGAVFDPQVDPAVSGDDVKTYVVPSTPAYSDAKGIAYTWYGPLRIDTAMSYRNNLHNAFTDGIGASNELLEVPDRYGILVTDATANTIRIHYDDPLTGLPVDLTDSFPPGTIFRIAGSQGEFEYQTNNYQYVVKSVSWDSTPIGGSPLTWTGSGDTIIEVDTDFDNLPPFVELDVISATNAGGPSATEPQLTVAGNLSGLVHQYRLDTGNAVVRFDQPIIDAWGPRNAATITRIEYSVGSPTTTTFTFDTNIIDEAFTGGLGFVVESFIGGLYYDASNAGGGSPMLWEDGYILRNALRIDTMPAGAAETTISENLDFGWGTTQRWAIKSTDAANDTIFIDGDITGILDPNDLGSITGSQGNDGDYEVASYSYNVGTNETEIVLRNPVLPVDPPAGFEGYFQLEDIDITGWYQYLILEADSTSNTFTVHGNATADVQSGMQFRVFGTVNDGLYTVTTAPIYDTIANTTEIQVASITNDDNGGWIESYRDYGIRLIFEDAIGVNIIENADAALVLTSGSLIDSFDYNYFDVGAFDENVATVLHLYGNTF